MEFDKIIDSIEKYVREFILYILSFFWIGRGDGKTDPVLEPLNRTAIFAVLSAAAGAYLWNCYIYDAQGGVHDLPRILTDTLLRWLSFGLFLYGLMYMFGWRPHILMPILAVFKVFSVAHILAIFAAYLARNGVWIVSTPDYHIEFGPRYAARTAYLVQAVLIVFYMPREIKGIGPADLRPRIRVTITALFLVVTSIIALANYLDPLSARLSRESIAGPEKPAAKGASK